MSTTHLTADNDAEQLWFLISQPRSGSTLLAHLLSHHQDVFSQSETWAMLALHEFGKVNIRSKFGSWHVHKATSDALGEHRQAVIPDMAQAIYRNLRPKDAPIFLDKTPRYYWIADWLYETLPSAKFIVLQRNPLAVAASHKSTWGIELLPQNLVKNSELTNFDMLLGHGKVKSFAANHIDSNRVINVHYENLVSDPEAECARIFNKFHPTPKRDDLPSYSIVAPAVDPARFGDPKILSTDSIQSASIEAYQDQLNDEEKNFLNAWFFPEGFEADNPISSTVEHFKARLEEKVRQIDEENEMAYDARIIGAAGESFVKASMLGLKSLWQPF